MLQKYFELAKTAVEAAGYTVGAGSYIDEYRNLVYVSSVESVPNTYGHPVAEVSFDGDTGWYSGKFADNKNKNFAVKVD